MNVVTVCRGKEDTVEQSSKSETGPEGGVVTLHCSYDTTSDSYTAYLFWYKQKPNDYPQYMLRRFSTGGGDGEKEFEGRFLAELNKTTKTVPLTIKNLQVSDSAVYYCALRPTVTAVCEVIIQKPAEKTYSCVYSDVDTKC